MNKIIEKSFPYLPWVFFFLMGQFLRRSHGHLRFNHLVYISISVVLVSFIFIKKPHLIRYPSKNILLIIWFLFSLMLFFFPGLIFADPKSHSYLILQGLLFINLISAIISLMSIRLIKSLKSLPFSFGAVAIIMAHILVIFLVPNPRIDVHSVLSLGADHLLSGLNPYSQSYPDFYKGAYGYVAGYVYWPVILFFTSFSKFIFGDVRFIYLLCLVISLYLTYKVTHTKQQQNSEQSLALALMWMSFPVTLFVLEQTWTEAILILEVALIFWALSREKWLLSAIFLGLACATKQYCLFLALFVGTYWIRQLGMKKALIQTCLTVITALVFFMPFILWDRQSFLHESVYALLTYPTRIDALSWPSYFARFHDFNIPSHFYLLVYGCLFLLLSLWLHLKSKLQLRDLFFSIWLMYGVVFLFGKQAFCNYYYFWSYLLLLALIAPQKDHSPVSNK